MPEWEKTRNASELAQGVTTWHECEKFSAHPLARAQSDLLIDKKEDQIEPLL